MHPRIRVCIPVAKPLRFVEAAISSLTSQKFSDWSAVVLDDRGDLELATYVNNLSDPRFTYVGPTSSPGIAANWNRSFRYADAEFLFLLHDDDVLEPEFLSDAVRLLDAHPATAAVHCRSVPIWESDNIVSKVAHHTKSIRWLLARLHKQQEIVTQGQRGLAELLIGQWMLTPTFVYRTEMIRTFQFNSLEFALDLEFLGRLLLSGNGIVGSFSQNHRMRIHAQSQTHQKGTDLTRFVEEVRVINQLSTAAWAQGWYLASVCGRLRPLFRLHILLRLVISLRAGDSSLRRILLRLFLS